MTFCDYEWYVLWLPLNDGTIELNPEQESGEANIPDIDQLYSQR